MSDVQAKAAAQALNLKLKDAQRREEQMNQQLNEMANDLATRDKSLQDTQALQQVESYLSTLHQLTIQSNSTRVIRCWTCCDPALRFECWSWNRNCGSRNNQISAQR